MQLFVRGLNNALTLVEATSASELRGTAGVAAGIPLFSTCGIVLDGDLAAQGITDGETIYALPPVDGGKKKKKKKKIFKGPKKPTHRHKNVPMRVLKFYKVEGDGEGAEYKVTHDRLECPHPDCGAGVFMAVHKDRQTCGKCSLTYVFQKK